MSTRKSLIAMLVVFVFVVLGWGIAGMASRAGKIKVTLNVAPERSVIGVDDKLVHGNTVYVSKGEHVFIARFMQFAPDKKTIKIQGPTTITLSPKPQSEGDFKYLSANPDVQREREAQGGEQATADGEKSAAKYSFLRQLPVETPEYSIYYGAPVLSKHVSGGDVAIYISAASPVGRRAALDRIQNGLDVDLSTVEIVFDNSFNVLSREPL